MSLPLDLTSHPHRRFNPLTNSWVLCSPHRTKRPWQGQLEVSPAINLPEYDPKCYLCPGNTRAQGEKNPMYKETFLFENDFAAVKIENDIGRMKQADEKTKDEADEASSLFLAHRVQGVCQVICYSPLHNVTVAELSTTCILSIITTWIAETLTAQSLPFVKYIQIFENKGSMMGCSNPHPHGQIWCTSVIPEEPAKELDSMKRYYNKCNKCLLCEYTRMELEKKLERIVCENASFVCLVPFWAVWPYETMIISKRHITSLVDLTQEEKIALADIIGKITRKYDNVFESSFPYSMGIHQAPVDGEEHVWDSHLHIHFYPPLLRNPTVKKFLVGFEMLGEPQRDLTPEQAASRLQQCSETHYKMKST
ncbi:7418_t:CDS:2 [Paraglomus occultum]|uniref:Galactose-1-phosphate uridylyltransferase n=1 Tax=Paraglomus occultum TaxID=144539 RepID=A0A9N8ZA17_9GLOM|nr:7418_t:CDS:2 [Paraglomus occultum]